MNECTDKPKTQFDGAWLTKSNDGRAENAEQDRTARMCRLVLLFTLRKER